MTRHAGADKNRILFIVPTLCRAGAETQLIDLVNSLDSRDFEKTLVVFERNIDQLDRLDEQNIAFHHYIRAHKYDFSMARKIARLIDENNIDVIHCTLQKSLLVGWLAVRFARTKPKLVIAIHTTVNVAWKPEFFDQVLYRWLVGLCGRVIFVCQAQAEYWKAKYPSSLRNKAAVIYNGVDLDYFHRQPFLGQGRELRREQSVAAGAAVITCIAGFRREKGHRYLIEAFARLEGDSYLLLAGDGPLRTEMEKFAKQKNVDDRVRFLGEVKDVRPLLAATDVFVLASTAVETFSMAMLESMAMEVPTIVTDIGGLREAVVPGETGELLAPAAPEQLADALQRYIGDRQLLRKMGEIARERVQERFSKDAMTHATAEILNEVSGRHVL